MLTDTDIRREVRAGNLGISPFDDAAVQPASYDVRLSSKVLVPKPHVIEIDLESVTPGHTVPWKISGQGMRIMPGQFLLACTEEIIRLDSRHAAQVIGKSSLGRLGLNIHVTAGFIDPGFGGQLTLQLVNLAPWSIMVYPSMKIAQVVFTRLQNQAGTAYGSGGLGSKYQDLQEAPTESRYKLDRLDKDS